MSTKPAPDFTLDEIAKGMAQLALELWQTIENQEPTDKGDEGLTTSEYAELWGVKPSTAKKRLKEMVDRGLMIRGKAFRKQKRGHWQRQPVCRPRGGTDGLQKTPE